jgi:hypothetical protein
MTEVPASQLNPPSKGKKASEKEMVDRINDGIKDWGEKYRNKAIWFVTL